ncbi:MAG: hypothetical protein L0170_02425 [Acidobacteria bacterium]|nr:hypothetical protein [Acidobacteriota bacterium]
MRNVLVLGLLVMLSCAERPDLPKPAVLSTGSSSDGPAKSAVISKGTKFSPKDYLVPGYVTLLDFYADW